MAGKAPTAGGYPLLLPRAAQATGGIAGESARLAQGRPAEQKAGPAEALFKQQQWHYTGSVGAKHLVPATGVGAAGIASVPIARTGAVGTRPKGAARTLEGFVGKFTAHQNSSLLTPYDQARRARMYCGMILRWRRQAGARRGTQSRLRGELVCSG